MAAEYSFREFQKTQQETLDRAGQAHRAYRDSLKALLPYKGGMHWKIIKGRHYLYKYRDRRGNGESLGPRSPTTERLHDEFGRQRLEASSQLRHRREQLAIAARFCRAALINRVPETIIRIVHRLEEEGLPGAPLAVIGTPALYVFEFAAGVFIDTPKNSPFWSGASHHLTLAGSATVPPDQFLRLLRRADRSFCALPGNDCQAVNNRGFLVRLIRPPMVRDQIRPAPNDSHGPMVPAESGDLTALLNTPRFSQVVIGKRGTPATMAAPDPRTLALHKLWLSQQQDRDPAKRSRDRVQALALAELILRYLPQYDFFSADLNLFPPEVVRKAQNLVEGYELLPALEFD
ncbi:MAG: GSU2403 family nucleotidyltransferase fold protein [Thermodesulfobacteriota bacterium]